MEEKLMKIKRLVSIILVLTLCLSVMLVSCTPGGNNNNDDPMANVNKNPENDKKVISDNLSEGSIGDVLDQVEAEATQVDFSELYNEIAKLAFSSELDVETEWLDGILALSMKDGVVAVDVSDEQTYMIIDPDFSVTTLSSFGDGFWVESEQMIPDDGSTGVTGGSLEEMLELPEGALETIKGFTFPVLDENSITLEDNWYVISDEYCKDVATAVLDLIVEISESYDEAPSSDEYDDAREQILAAVDALDLKIGFAVIGDNVVGIKISVDANVEELSEIFEDTASATPYAEEKEEENIKTDEKFKAEVELWLTEDAANISSFKTTLDIDIGGGGAKGDISFDYNYNEGLPSGMSMKIDLEYAEDEDDVSKMKGDMSFGILYDEAEVCGVEVDVDMSMTNIAVGGEYYETNTDEYGEYVNCMGDIEIDVSLLVDLSKLSQVNEKPVSINADITTTGKSLYYETYDYETDEYTKSTDMSIFVDAPSASDYNAAVSIKGSATVTDENKIGVEFKVSADEETPVKITGTLNLDDADDIVLPSGLDSKTLAEAYASIYASAEEIADSLEYDYDMWEIDGYYIHDTESGLYAYISSYGYVEYVGTVLPTDEEFIDYYGNYIEYGA